MHPLVVVKWIPAKLLHPHRLRCRQISPHLHPQHRPQRHRYSAPRPHRRRLRARQWHQYLLHLASSQHRCSLLCLSLHHFTSIPFQLLIKTSNRDQQRTLSKILSLIDYMLELEKRLFCLSIIFQKDQKRDFLMRDERGAQGNVEWYMCIADCSVPSKDRRMNLSQSFIKSNRSSSGCLFWSEQ